MPLGPIAYGPFHAEFHFKRVDAAFKNALVQFLTVQLLPQMEEPYFDSGGSLVACFDESRFCGPLSAVRDRYRLEFHFRREDGTDEIKVDIEFDEPRGTFRPVGGNPLYLLTRKRLEHRRYVVGTIEALCRQLETGQAKTGTCPICGLEVCTESSPGSFSVRCKADCFDYEFSREVDTKGVRRGHFYVREEGREIGQGLTSDFLSD
ncbi:MAG: hypothetical protein HYY18_15370 [Planctomycetes bacterium]|nr:hypothetical protein [Planctomycetota bacterium]